MYSTNTTNTNSFPFKFFTFLLIIVFTCAIVLSPLNGSVYADSTSTGDSVYPGFFESDLANIYGVGGNYFARSFWNYYFETIGSADTIPVPAIDIYSQVGPTTIGSDEENAYSYYITVLKYTFFYDGDYYNLSGKTFGFAFYLRNSVVHSSSSASLVTTTPDKVRHIQLLLSNEPAPDTYELFSPNLTLNWAGFGNSKYYLVCTPNINFDSYYTGNYMYIYIYLYSDAPINLYEVSISGEYPFKYYKKDLPAVDIAQLFQTWYICEVLNYWFVYGIKIDGNTGTSISGDVDLSKIESILQSMESILATFDFSDLEKNIEDLNKYIHNTNNPIFTEFSGYTLSWIFNDNIFVTPDIDEVSDYLNSDYDLFSIQVDYTASDYLTNNVYYLNSFTLIRLSSANKNFRLSLDSIYIDDILLDSSLYDYRFLIDTELSSYNYKLYFWFNTQDLTYAAPSSIKFVYKIHNYSSDNFKFVNNNTFLASLSPSSAGYYTFSQNVYEYESLKIQRSILEYLKDIINLSGDSSVVDNLKDTSEKVNNFSDEVSNFENQYSSNLSTYDNDIDLDSSGLIGSFKPTTAFFGTILNSIFLNLDLLQSPFIVTLILCVISYFFVKLISPRRKS